MKYLTQTGPEPADDYDLLTLFARIGLTLLFGGLLILGWRLLAQDRPKTHIPFRRRGLLTVEDAVRWRPEF